MFMSMTCEFVGFAAIEGPGRRFLFERRGGPTNMRRSRAGAPVVEW